MQQQDRYSFCGGCRKYEDHNDEFTEKCMWFDSLICIYLIVTVVTDLAIILLNEDWLDQCLHIEVHQNI